MGNHHSQEHHNSRKSHRNRSKEQHQHSVPVSPVTTPPDLSRCSSISDSRPTSVMGDVRVCVQKILGKSQSTVDVTTSVASDNSNRGTYKRSTSAPAELFSGDSQIQNSSQLRSCQTSNSKYCFPTDEIEQDRLTNTVKYFFCINDLVDFCTHILLNIALCTQALFWREFFSSST
jgi:hypothetical protein